jgi:hypothetical protein
MPEDHEPTRDAGLGPPRPPAETPDMPSLTGPRGTATHKTVSGRGDTHETLLIILVVPRTGGRLVSRWRR